MPTIKSNTSITSEDYREVIDFMVSRIKENPTDLLTLNLSIVKSEKIVIEYKETKEKIIGQYYLWEYYADWFTNLLYKLDWFIGSTIYLLKGLKLKKAVSRSSYMMNAPYETKEDIQNELNKIFTYTNNKLISLKGVKPYSKVVVVKLFNNVTFCFYTDDIAAPDDAQDLSGLELNFA